MFYKNLSFKKCFCLLAIVFFFQFCKKNEVMTDLDFRKQLLAGSGTFQNVENNWKLDSTYINGVAVVLTPYQKTFVKTFMHNGLVKDSELNTSSNSDILNIRDEILGNLNQFTYLLTFK